MVACCRVRGTECGSVCMGPLEGGWVAATGSFSAAERSYPTSEVRGRSR